MYQETTDRLWNAILVGLDVVEITAVVLPVIGILLTLVLAVRPRWRNRRVGLPELPRMAPRAKSIEPTTPPGTWLGTV
jgi:hypothetical protein